MKSFHQSAMALASTARLGVTVHAAESGPGGDRPGPSHQQRLKDRTRHLAYQTGIV